MYTSDIPTFEIDLFLDEAERWADVIAEDAAIARRVVAEGMEDYEAYSPFVINVGSWILGKLYRHFGGRYRREIEAWAEALGLTPDEATVLNCSYEMSHLGASLPFGCTAGARWVEGMGMVHVRSMDWPMASIGEATRIFHFVDGGREFISVGILGHVSVLSGMVPGAYSVTLNWAPPVGLPHFDWGPSFLLRETLETCDTYADAVEVLANTPLAVPVFFFVCGTKKGQACVIERTRRDHAIRKMRGAVLVQANHHVTARFRERNESFEDVAYSRARARALKEALIRFRRPRRLEDVASALDVDPVCNEESYQQMVFCAATGEFRAWRWIEEP